MSNDMSMFKKMKERITDEVNSATNKLQNMQIIDQLASSIGQQINEMTPNQLLPQHIDPLNHNHVPVSSQFSLVDDTPIGGYDDEEELNSDLSPQQLLFNENSIRRLNSSSSKSCNRSNTSGTSSVNHSNNPVSMSLIMENKDIQPVIDIEEYSSDLEEDLNNGLLIADIKEDGLDVEIDLLSDKPVSTDNILPLEDKDKSNISSSNYLSHFKAKYRKAVHALRELNEHYKTEKKNSIVQREELMSQITALKTELDNMGENQNSNQHDSLLSVSTSNSENEKISTVSVESETNISAKSESIVAKYKDTIKHKDVQIENLKKSLIEMKKYKDDNQELKHELNDLRDAQETWTVSIAENKRRMHQEIEIKNQEMEKLKAEINELQKRLADSNSRNRQLKSAIQDLESRLVSTSAAHQKERESLTKELTLVKNNAIKQLQKENEHYIERVKLDLEKYIEGLKLELLNKDEQIIKNAEKSQQELHELNIKLDLMTTANDDQEKEIGSLKLERDSLSVNFNSLKLEFDELLKKNESLSRVIHENDTDMQTHQDQLDQLTRVEHELDLLKKENSLTLESIQQLKSELGASNNELNQLRTLNEDLHAQNAQLRIDLENSNKEMNDLRKDKDSILKQNENSIKHKRELHEQLVVRILSAIKNLETPTTSPGSDKSYNSFKNNSNEEECKELPDPITMMDELSSLALDRCNAYMTASQRLQAVLLDNTMISEELGRLKDELNELNKEKTMENQNSIDELDKLKTENQALIHDQHFYDDRIKILEDELNSQALAANNSDHTYQIKALQRVLSQYQEENKRLKESLKNLETQISKSNDSNFVPDPMEFEYLKNIVYQFMLGKQPLVLARVISAVFKFDNAQIEQICKIQEAVQSAIKQSI